MRNTRTAVIVVIGWALLSTTAQAYIGPGLGAGVIGTILGVAGAILLAIFAVAYYPIKRALKRRREANTDKVHKPK